jgi:hypothetical protein
VVFRTISGTKKSRFLVDERRVSETVFAQQKFNHKCLISEVISFAEQYLLFKDRKA